MIIDRDNRQWSIDFVSAVLSYPFGNRGLKLINNLFENHRGGTVCQENPYWFFTYHDLTDDDPYQRICKDNEVVLSMDFVGYEEEIQVLTYDELREIVDYVLNKQKQ